MWNSRIEREVWKYDTVKKSRYRSKREKNLFKYKILVGREIKGSRKSKKLGHKRIWSWTRKMEWNERNTGQEEEKMKFGREGTDGLKKEHREQFPKEEFW